MQEVVHEWIIYDNHRYSDYLLYAKEIVFDNGLPLVTEVTKAVREAKRFDDKDATWRLAKRCNQKVAHLERKITVDG